MKQHEFTYFEYFHHWCSQATKKILYRPDREAVYMELYGHLEDRFEAYISEGFSTKVAMEKALASMGEPEPVAVQLGSIHRPWLGYLLRLTNIVLIPLLCLTVLRFISFSTTLSFQHPNRGDWDYYEDTTHGTGDYALVRDLYLEPEQSVSSDGYTLTLTRAAQWSPAPGALPDNECHFFFQIEVTNPRPWAEFAHIGQDLWAVDSLGNYYYSSHEYAYSYEGAIRGNFYHTGFFTHTLDMWFDNYVSQDAEWIRICYDRSGRDLLFHIDLTDTPNNSKDRKEAAKQ